MHVQMTQHPVGQGGFFSGCLEAGASQLRWIYDCGSNQRDALTREIGTLQTKDNFDVMFLSHLDSDHVSGVDLILSQCVVREVVLPYLEDEVVLAVLAQDVARGRLSGLFIDVMSDVAGWFGGRGVERVTSFAGEAMMTTAVTPFYQRVEKVARVKVLSRLNGRRSRTR